MGVLGASRRLVRLDDGVIVFIDMLARRGGRSRVRRRLPREGGREDEDELGKMEWLVEGRDGEGDARRERLEVADRCELCCCGAS
jgi:hypothetical protein